MIDVRDLHRSFGGVTALDGVTLAVAEGERRAIIGPNGAGKTTLFNILTGELAPTGGTVRLAGEDVTGRRTFELARRGLARMYQRNELFDPLTARENVALALTAKAGPYRFGGIPADEARAADELLERVGLAGAGATPARALSHGQRRQLELAVALATAPRVLLLDEEDREPGTAQRDEGVAHLADELWRESLGWLVQKEECGVSCERAADREHLLLATRELVAAVSEPARERGKELEDAPLVPAARDRAGGEREVFAHAEIGEHPAALRHQRHTGARHDVRRRAGEIPAADQHAAASRAKEPDEGGDRRRLPRAVAAEQDRGLPFRHVERDALEDEPGAVARVEVADRERVHSAITFPR